MSDKDVEIDLKTGELVDDDSQEHEDHDEGDEQEDSSHEGSDDEGSDDEGSEHEATDEHGDEHSDEREAIRERRRNERKQRRAAQKEREDNLRRELAARDAVINELRGKVDVIERRNTGSELAQLDNVKQQTAQAYAYFKDQIRVATETSNGALVAEATEKMLQARQRFDELERIEKAYKSQRATPQPLDPRLVTYAKAWMDGNKWYRPDGRDMDSRIVLTIDQTLADEGYDSTTAEYWAELTQRVKKHLPHRSVGVKINSSANKPPRPAVPSARKDGGGSSQAGSYKLSAERVQALKEAGVWDDPGARANAIKYFRDYDKSQKGV